MKEAQLGPLLAQDEESRVGEFQDFRNVKPPKCLCKLHKYEVTKLLRICIKITFVFLNSVLQLTRISCGSKLTRHG